MLYIFNVTHVFILHCFTYFVLYFTYTFPSSIICPFNSHQLYNYITRRSFIIWNTWIFPSFSYRKPKNVQRTLKKSFDWFKVCFSHIFGQFPCLGSSRNRIPDLKEGAKGISEFWRPRIKHFGTVELWKSHILFGDGMGHCPTSSSPFVKEVFSKPVSGFTHIRCCSFWGQMVLQISGKEVSWS